MREATVQAIEEIVKLSPVDTGLFRANWQFSAGSPATGVVNRLDPTGSGTIASESSKARATLRYNSNAYFVNNLPYAQALEYGSSRQAPHGMIRLTAARWPVIVDEAVKRVGANK
jgi:hypothetical protein